MQRAVRVFFASVAVVLVACGGSTPAAAPEQHGHHPDYPACATLAKTCHAHDKDSDKAHACHVLGHSAPSNEECEAKRAECLAVCSGADGGA